MNPALDDTGVDTSGMDTAKGIAASTCTIALILQKKMFSLSLALWRLCLYDSIRFHV